jgi:hypothetical protein
MKNIIIIGIMAASILMTGCGNKAAYNALYLEKTKKEVAQSQVVGYASANINKTTNILFTITEIWKGSEKASTLGMTNGMQFSDDNYQSAANLPDGEIIIFSRDARGTTEQTTIYVWSGRVEDMTVKEFKAKIGL